MSKEETRIIEVNGIKLEVDLRNAKRVDQFKVGDSVKVLTEKYNDQYEINLGVIIGFDEFDKNPTIVIAYLVVDYSGAEIKFAYINSKTKEMEICPVNDWDIPFSKQDVLSKMDNEIMKKQEEIRDLESKRKYFTEMFGKYFETRIPATKE